MKHHTWHNEIKKTNGYKWLYYMLLLFLCLWMYPCKHDGSYHNKCMHKYCSSKDHRTCTCIMDASILSDIINDRDTLPSTYLSNSALSVRKYSVVILDYP